jgi:hypothetical protein
MKRFAAIEFKRKWIMPFCSPTHLTDQFYDCKSVGEHQPSLPPSPKFFVRFSLPPGISMSGLEKSVIDIHPGFW